jgi:hypothetical protein
MVQTGSHQEAMAASTNFRLLGQTIPSNVVLRRNLAAVSGAPAEHFELHPDGFARAVDDCEEGQYPIENIINERVGAEGQTQYLIVYAGDWRPIDKYVWVDASGCQPADIANFKFKQQVTVCELSDLANGITAENTQPATRNTQSTVATGRVQKAQPVRRSNTRPRPSRISRTSVAAIKAALTESESDCEGEDVSEGEQALYASRSAFGR